MPLGKCINLIAAVLELRARCPNNSSSFLVISLVSSRELTTSDRGSAKTSRSTSTALASELGAQGLLGALVSYY